ncbi:MAG: hypothetical protein AAGN66_15745 [Acidobacteriota bacterium]
MKKWTLALSVVALVLLPAAGLSAQPATADSGSPSGFTLMIHSSLDAVASLWASIFAPATPDLDIETQESSDELLGHQPGSDGPPEPDEIGPDPEPYG